jgi:hypothetical protein
VKFRRRMALLIIISFLILAFSLVQLGMPSGQP